jgi:hypothetical protein
VAASFFIGLIVRSLFPCYSGKKATHTSAGGFTIGEYMRLTKRTDYISWDEYFMGIAILSSAFPEIYVEVLSM